MIDVTSILHTLRTVADELTEMSMTLLSDAISEGATHRPPEEKAISQARRTVEKAIMQLSKVE
jgi:hypothetical protein